MVVVRLLIEVVNGLVFIIATLSLLTLVFPTAVRTGPQVGINQFFYLPTAVHVLITAVGLTVVYFLAVRGYGIELPA